MFTFTVLCSVCLQILQFAVLPYPNRSTLPWQCHKLPGYRKGRQRRRRGGSLQRPGHMSNQMGRAEEFCFAAPIPSREVFCGLCACVR